MISDYSFTDGSMDEEEHRPKRKRKRKTPKQDDRQKKSTSTMSEQPSVYSSSEIRRHEKRLKRLKALEKGSDSESEVESENENVDPDLDINLRIFESSMTSVDNMIIGEIQCNVKDDANVINDASSKINKNSSVFKLSVNANFEENATEQSTENIEHCSDQEKSEIVEDSHTILASSSCGEFTDSDSDLEILMSKPIVRKRATPAAKKDKPVINLEDKKLTMYDLIFDSMSSRKKDNDDTSEDETVESKKKNTDKKVEVKDENSCEVVDSLKPNESEEKLSLAVPQLKVTADGEVVVDMDSLVVEQTGLSEARNAIANSEVIDEYGFGHTSYSSKKKNVPKHWSPQDTLKFYQVLSTIGTDFSLMATLFPGRTRTCMKRKFKREEKANCDLILKALSCRQNFDMGLLEEELRIKEEKVNKLREISRKEKASTKKTKNNEEADKNKDKKVVPKSKRRSFFDRSIQLFQR